MRSVQMHVRHARCAVTYPGTAGLERELAPPVTREILAVRDKQGRSLPLAIRAVVKDWWYRARPRASASESRMTPPDMFRVGLDSQRPSWINFLSDSSKGLRQ
jgi:hypothetical protein